MKTDTLVKTTTESPVREIPAEQLEHIPTAPKRLAANKIDRTAVDIGEARGGVSSRVAPRAWTMGGNVD